MFQIFYDSVFSILIISTCIIKFLGINQFIPILIGYSIYQKRKNIFLSISIGIVLYVFALVISFFSVWVYAGIPEFSFLDVILIFLTIFLFKRRRFITIFVLWKAVEIAVYFFGSTFFSDRIQ